MTKPIFSSLETKRYFGFRTSVKHVTWNADGTRLVCSGDVSNVLHYDTSTLSDVLSPVKSASDPSPAKPPLNPATNSTTTNNSASTIPIYECRSQSKDISALLASPTSPSMFAVAGFDKIVNVFDSRLGSRPVQTCSLPCACLYADWSPDGNTIGVGLASDSIAFLDCLSWSLRSDKTKMYEAHLSLNQFQWTPDGSRILLGRSSGYAHLLEWPSMSHVHTLRGHVATCSNVACDPRGRYFAVSSVDTTVSVWDARTLSNLFSIDRRDVPLLFLSFRHDGEVLAVAGQFDGIDLIDPHTGSLLHVIPTSSRVTSLSWHPTKPLLAYTLIKQSSRDRYNLSAESGPPVFVWGLSSSSSMKK